MRKRKGLALELEVVLRLVEDVGRVRVEAGAEVEAEAVASVQVAVVIHQSPAELTLLWRRR